MYVMWHKGHRSTIKYAYNLKSYIDFVSYNTIERKNKLTINDKDFHTDSD